MQKTHFKIVEKLNLCFSHLITITIVLTIFNTHLFASQGVASTGIWGNTSTWFINGTNRIPTCGDTLTIPSGVTVTVNSQFNLSACSEKMFLSISGTLQFNNGYKLTLPCYSSVVLNAGGLIKKTTAGGGSSTQINICSCSSWTAGDGPINGPKVLNCSLLPITLLAFNAVESDEGVDLFWMTASEINNEYFNCERSVNGKDFVSFEKIKGAGNSTETNDYSFTDKNPVPGVIYYRLKQTDYDGNFSYSDIVAINCKTSKKLKLSKVYMDSTRRLNLSMINPKNEILILLMDISGKVIYKEDLYLTPGHTNFTIPFSDINSGSYLLTITNGEEKVSENIFIGN